MTAEMKYYLLLAAFHIFVYALPPSLTRLSVGSRDTSTCPFNLPVNGYEFPHLIIPITALQPDLEIGNSFLPSISPNVCATIFNFDIPTSRAGQQCSLYLTLPGKDQLVTSDFKFSGPGTFDFVQYVYNEGANITTTYNSQPVVTAEVAQIHDAQPGAVGSYRVWRGSCGPGGVMSWRMSSPDTTLWYFQDEGLCPLGVWIIYE